MLSRRVILMGGLAAGGAFGGLSAAQAAKAKPQYGAFGIATEFMDRTVAPGEDFYRYVNAGWDKVTTIPSDKSSYGALTVLRDLSEARSHELMEQAGQPGSSGNTKKIGDYYAAFMDEAAIEARGAAPLQPDLARIAAIATAVPLAQAIRCLNRDTSASLPANIDLGVEQERTSR